MRGVPGCDVKLIVLGSVFTFFVVVIVAAQGSVVADEAVGETVREMLMVGACVLVVVETVAGVAVIFFWAIVVGV